MSALPPKADMDQSGCDVRFVPKADILRCGKDWRFKSPRRRTVPASPKSLTSVSFGLTASELSAATETSRVVLPCEAWFGRRRYWRNDHKDRHGSKGPTRASGTQDWHHRPDARNLYRLY